MIKGFSRLNRSWQILTWCSEKKITLTKSPWWFQQQQQHLAKYMYYVQKTSYIMQTYIKQLEFTNPLPVYKGIFYLNDCYKSIWSTGFSLITVSSSHIVTRPLFKQNTVCQNSVRPFCISSLQGGCERERLNVFILAWAPCQYSQGYFSFSGSPWVQPLTCLPI